MEQNEQVIVRVYQDKEAQWHDRLRDWSNRLEQAITSEQRLIIQCQQLQDDKRGLQTRVDELHAEKFGLQRKV